ncbi:MAG: efflux RND transporter periplasmic adaptor subunit [Kangiellaceae bacterium]|jgi:membrane fusion protein (multidrug efflux system)
MKQKLPAILTILFFAVLITYLQWPESHKGSEQKARVTKVRAADAQLAEFRDIVEALATTRANEQILVTTKYADVVKSLSFEDGQSVKKGDVLVQLDRQEEQAKVRELEANLEEAVVQLNRLQDLLKNRATSKSQVDQQEAMTKAIRAQLTNARIRLNDTTIKAPFAGILGFRQVSVGAYLVPGDVITSLDDISQMKLDFSVPERFLPTIAVGQPINATSDAYGEKLFTGKITSISPRIDPITRTLRVRAEITNEQGLLRPGMLLKLKIVRQVESVLQIPESALIPIEERHYVFVISDGSVKRKEIKIGRRQPGFVEVISGLSASEKVVTEGTLKIRDGSQVTVLEN